MGCRHAQHFGRHFGFVPSKDRAEHEASWDKEAEGVFAAVTDKWTELQREAFRARLWPKLPPVVPKELFDFKGEAAATPEKLAEVKRWNDAHKAGDEDLF